MTAPAREYSATITRITIFINALPSEFGKQSHRLGLERGASGARPN